MTIVISLTTKLLSGRSRSSINEWVDVGGQKNGRKEEREGEGNS